MFLSVSISRTFPFFTKSSALEFSGPSQAMSQVASAHWRPSLRLGSGGLGRWTGGSRSWNLGQKVFCSLVQLWKLYVSYFKFASKKKPKPQINKTLILSMLTLTNLVSVWQKREDKNSHLIFSLQIVRLQTAFALKDDSLLCSHSWIFVMSGTCLKKIMI